MPLRLRSAVDINRKCLVCIDINPHQGDINPWGISPEGRSRHVTVWRNGFVSQLPMQGVDLCKIDCYEDQKPPGLK